MITPLLSPTPLIRLIFFAIDAIIAIAEFSFISFRYVISITSLMPLRHYADFAIDYCCRH
jgi:hypothetical protein